MKLVGDLGVLWQRRYWRAAFVVAASIALVVLLLGGFKRAPQAASNDAPESGPGQRFETGAFALTPLCAWATDLYPGQPQGMRRQRNFLVLRVQVQNLADGWLAMGAYLAEDVVWLADGRGDPRKPKYSQRSDDHTLPLLQPGLPVKVDLIWEVPTGTVVTGRPTWGVYRRRHVERGYLAGDEFWVQDGPGKRLPITLTAPCSGAG